MYNTILTTYTTVLPASWQVTYTHILPFRIGEYTSRIYNTYINNNMTVYNTTPTVNNAMEDESAHLYT